jgi:hypothetical protein
MERQKDGPFACRIGEEVDRDVGKIFLSPRWENGFYMDRIGVVRAGMVTTILSSVF